MMQKIQMVDLKGQYEKIKTEVDKGIQACIDATAFIKGPAVKEFEQALQQYLHCRHVISCANGTDALQIAMMALGLKSGDEVIVPAFTYVATAEVIGLLGLVPVMVDVDPDTFNITADHIEPAITERTKAVVPVHLFGQCADMEPIMELARKHSLYVIEDTAQAIGAEYTSADGSIKKAGTIGHIGCTSFFPSKNLGCFGDGGALYTNDDRQGELIGMLANHGQVKKYVHKYIGVNSRLDTLQAAVLNVKLRHLDEYAAARNSAASFYDQAFEGIEELTVPVRQHNSTHVFHQYTLKVKNGKREGLMAHLQANGIPCMIYYPVPLNEQEAFKEIGRVAGTLDVTESLCREVLSIPMHTELDNTQLELITNTIRSYFKQ